MQAVSCLVRLEDAFDRGIAMRRLANANLRYLKDVPANLLLTAG